MKTDNRMLCVRKSGKPVFFALHVLSQTPPRPLAMMRHGFKTQNKLKDYCAENGFALFKCANDLRVS